MVKMELDEDNEKPVPPSIQVVLPGDPVRQVAPDATIKLGPGVMQLPLASTSGHAAQQESKKLPTVDLIATRSGILGNQISSSGKKDAKTSSELCWVEGQSKRVSRTHAPYTTDTYVSQSYLTNTMAY